MAFDEAAFRTKAEAAGFSPDKVDAFVAQKASAATPAPEVSAFDETSFRTKAEGKFTPEQIDAFVATKRAVAPVEVPSGGFTPAEVLKFGSAVTPRKGVSALGAEQQQAFSPETLAAGAQKVSRKIPKPTVVVRETADGLQVMDPAKPFTAPTRTPLAFPADTSLPELPDAQIEELAAQIGADPFTQDGVNAVHSHVQRQKNWAQDKTQVLANLQELTSIDRPFQWMASTFDTAADAEYTSIKRQNIDAIGQLAADRGIDLVYQEEKNQFFVRDEHGNMLPATPGMFQKLGVAKFEAIGGLAGAVTGSRLGGSNPMARLLTTTLGAIGGTVLGEEVDYLSAAISTQEELDAKVAMEKALGAAQTGIVFEALGLGAIKLGKASYAGVERAYHFFRDNNVDGAFKELKVALGYLDDAEVEDIIKRWETVNQAAAPGASTAEKALHVLPTTSAGAEAVVAGASAVNPRVTSVLRADLNNRAQTVKRLAQAPESTPEDLRKGLADYVSQVKSSYAVVKDQAVDLVPPSFQFNLKNTTMRPLLEETIDEVADPVVAEKLVRVLNKVDRLTTGRTFQDLLDLRELLNEFKFANKITSKSKFVANKGIDAARAEVDDQIATAMKKTPEGRQWLKDWKGVNKSYGEFKALQKNALFKMLTKAEGQGTTAKSMANALVKFGPSIDNTYSDVIAKLPIKVKGDVEQEIVSQLTTKFSIGTEGGFNAIDFPALAKELSTYPFTSAKANQLKQGITELSEVYKNDPNLAQLGSRLSEEGGQGFFQTLWGKLKAETMANVWKGIKRGRAGPRADISALVNNVSKFMNEPMNKDAAEKVFKSIADDEVLTASLKRFQAEAAKAQASGEARALVKTYKDRRGRLFFQPGTGRRVASDKIAAHRIGNGEEIAELLGKDITNGLKLTKLEKANLIDKGYSAIGMPDGRLLLLL